MFNWICSTTDCWSATGSMMSGWAAWAGVGAVIYTANRAFATYRRQKQEDRRIEAAEEILSFAYKFKRTLTGARSPGILAYELSRAEKTLAESWNGWEHKDPQDQSRLKTAQAMLQRLRDNNAVWGQIFDLMPRARALFGEKAEAQLQAFWEAYVTVEIACDSYAEDNGTDQGFTKELRTEMWRRAKGDPVAEKVDAAIAVLDEMLLPVIRADHRPIRKKPPDA